MAEQTSEERWKEMVGKVAARKQADAAALFGGLMQQDVYLRIEYDIAIEGKSDKYNDALDYEALALCGDPYSALSGRKWGRDALYFLASLASKV